MTQALTFSAPPRNSVSEGFVLLRRIAIFVALFTVSAAYAAIESPVHRTFNVGPGGTLTLDADLGDIQLAGGGNGVTIDVIRRARTSSQSRANEIFRDLDLTFDQAGNDVHVRARYEHPARWFNWSNDLDLRFVITVPSRYNVQLGTSGGDIRVGDLQGDVRVKTSGGSIDLGHITGPVDGRTSGGDVTVAGARGRVDVHTSGGSIRIGDTEGPVQAKTSGGSIDIRHAAGDLYARTSGGSIVIEEALGTVDAQTSGGSIRARLAQQPSADSRLATSGGNITVSLAPNVSVDVDAHTSGGDVESDLPITLLGRQSESRLEGKINGGGPKLVLRSSGGGIRLRRL
jgi:putative adhesin